jgi:hypothetical protein
MGRSMLTLVQLFLTLFAVVVCAARSPHRRSPQGTPTAGPSDFLPLKVTGSIHVHDPGVVKTSDGTYILLSTGKELPIRTSKDRVVSIILCVRAP